jgi:hypothetical protein
MITKYPTRYPRTIIMYENLEKPTSPGMEMNVTPEIEAPIIPYATTYHGETFLPRKNVKLSGVLAAIRVII